MLNIAVENGITLELGKGEDTEGRPGRARGARMGGSRGEPESEAAVTVAWKPHSRVGGHGHRRAEGVESSKRHLGRRGAGSAAVSPGASSWLTRTASGARSPGRNGQMFQLLLSPSHCR